MSRSPAATPKGSSSANPAPWIFYMVKRWYSAGHARVETVTRAHGMTAADYSMLATLGRKGPCSSADLARLTGISPQGVTQQVAQLENKGLVVRYENQANRRITLVEMSDQGRENLTTIDARVNEIQREVLADVPAEEVAIIKAFLSKPPYPSE